MGKSIKKNANVNPKKRSAMELARVAAEKVKKSADKHKMKRPREAESEDELLSVKKEKKMIGRRPTTMRVGRRRVGRVIVLLKQKYRNLNQRLKSKTTIPNWMPSTKIRHNLN